MTCACLAALTGTVHFVDNACDNVEHVLPQEITGQELALTHLTEVLCQHMAQKQPLKPLVISVHGPPGVGKTYTHLWLARTLYNTHPSADLDCPGIHCRGYKVSSCQHSRQPLGLTDAPAAAPATPGVKEALSTWAPNWLMHTTPHSLSATCGSAAWSNHRCSSCRYPGSVCAVC